MNVMKKKVKKVLSIFLPQQIYKRIIYRSLYKNKCKLGNYCEIDGVNIIKNNVMMSDYSTITNSEIDIYTSVGRNSRIFNSKIGKFCSISWNVTIGATSHPYSTISSHAFPYTPYAGNFVKEKIKNDVKTNIGNDVWIGCNSVIMPGINIGDGAVIGAGSVVTKDIEPYAIYGGVPAKLIKYRFDKETIKRLLEVKWWDKEISSIKENIRYFQNDLDDNIINIIERI